VAEKFEPIDFWRRDDKKRRRWLANNMGSIVKLERRALGGFGFSVIGGVDTHLPPMICAVVQNGSAHLSGRVSIVDSAASTLDLMWSSSEVFLRVRVENSRENLQILVNEILYIATR
jgi:hypothetical protein